MNNEKRCQICGSYNIKKVTKDQEFKYKKYIIIIKDYKSIECDDCKNGIVEEESYKKSIPILKKFHQDIDKINNENFVEKYKYLRSI